MKIVHDPEGFSDDDTCLLNRSEKRHAPGTCGACDSEWGRDDDEADGAQDESTRVNFIVRNLLRESYLDPHDPRPPVSVPQTNGTCKACGFEGLVRSKPGKGQLCTDCYSKNESKLREEEDKPPCADCGHSWEHHVRGENEAQSCWDCECGEYER